MKKVTCVATLRITFEPNLDTPQDIEEKVKEEIEFMMKRGHLDGCEHGSQIDSWHLEVSTTNIE